MTLENILRTDLGFSSALAGALRDAVVETAKELAADFTTYRPRKRLPHPKPIERREFDPEKTYPVWRRDRGQGLAEYALVLVLVAIIAIIALIFLGSQVSSALSEIGNSI